MQANRNRVNAASPSYQASIGKDKPAVIPNTNVSIIDYLSSKGMAFDKASRARLAKQYGIENYDYSAGANTRLLAALKAPSNTFDPNVGMVKTLPKVLTGAKGGRIEIDKCGGKVKAPDRVKKAKLKK